LTAGLGGMGGAQPLAVTMNEGVALCVEVDPERLARRLDTGYLDERADDLADATARAERAAAEGRAVSVGLVGNAADVFGELLAAGFRPDVVTDQTSAHDPLGGGVPRGGAPGAAPGGPGPGPRPATPSRPGSRCPATARPWSGFSGPGPRCSTTATTCAARPGRPGSRTPSPTRGSCPPTSGRCSARARGRSAGPPCPATRPTSPAPTGPCWSCSATTSTCAAGSPLPPSGSGSRGCRPGSAGSATASVTRPGWPSTSWSRGARSRP